MRDQNAPIPGLDPESLVEGSLAEGSLTRGKHNQKDPGSSPGDRAFGNRAFGDRAFGDRAKGTATPLSPPEKLMRLDRMGSAFPTRLSFSRSLIRQLARDGSTLQTQRWELDDEGYGTAVLTTSLGGHRYSLVAFSHALDADQRTDRVIATAWDSVFVLYDGVPDDAELERLRANTPKQEAGRYSKRDLTLSRANKSVRLFEEVVTALAQGEQPPRQRLIDTGYLMRTTAVYGNGKFGIADRFEFSDRPGLAGPFQAEMLTVYLIRAYTFLLIDYIASKRNLNAAKLSAENKHCLGVGNATGLGMAPFLVSHPALLNAWVLAKEYAYTQVLAVEAIGDGTRAKALVERAKAHIAQWNVEDETQQRRTDVLHSEFQEITDGFDFSAPWPWVRLSSAASTCSLETQELVTALALECHPELIDDFENCLSIDTQPKLDAAMNIGALKQLIEDCFGWALDIDFSKPENSAQFWYTSIEKLEPRLGKRYDEPGAEQEHPLDIARRVSALYDAIHSADPAQLVGRFVVRHPQHRLAAKRVQFAAKFPYGEIQDNLIDAHCRPIDMLRFKLAFFGASKFDPKSDLWTRITLFQGAPNPEELTKPDADDWWLPAL